MTTLLGIWLSTAGSSIRALLSLKSVVYAHRETMLPCLPGLNDQAVGTQDLHQHCRSDIALQVQQTEPDGGPRLPS